MNRSPCRRWLMVAVLSISPTMALEAQDDLTKQLLREEAQARASAVVIDSARRLVATLDSNRAMRLLRDAAAKDKDNGPLWYEYGALLSAMSRPGWRKGIMPAYTPQMIIAAESSLARAVRLTPDSAHYATAYARHLWGANVMGADMAARAQRDAYDKLVASGEKARVAEAADQLGMITWRRFEPLIGRGTPLQIDGSGVFLSREGLQQFVRENFRKPTEMFGADMADEALRYFATARSSAPDNETYFRHEMMVLAELGRWEEAEAIARKRRAEQPKQAWPWLVLGLTHHHMRRLNAAQDAFDSGFVRLPESDRNRLESIAKLMPNRRENWYDGLTAYSKSLLHELYWNTANPTMLLPGNIMQAEFRARVVFAELRFTDDEKPTLGANSQKGEVYIRYGAPDVIMQGVIIPRHAPRTGQPQTWVYFKELMVFTFEQAPMYGTAYHTAGSITDFDSSKVDRPTAWTNLPHLRHRVDSVTTQVARFRAENDSVDIAVFAGFRAGALRRGAETDSSTLRHGVYMVDALGRMITHTTRSEWNPERDTTVLLGRNYFMRTTNQVSAVRVEALGPDEMQVARSMIDLTGFNTKGFGVSDVLIAASVTPPPDGAGVPRWSDYAITSLTGTEIKRGSPLALIWENYEPGTADGVGKLLITVRLQQETSSGLVAMSSRVVGGIREAMGGARAASSVGITYERQFRPTPVLVDHVILDAGVLQPGRYRVSLTVTDQVRKQTVNRVQRFVIVP